MRLAEIVEQVGGVLVGDGECRIHAVRKIEEAGPGDISFIANPKYEKYAESTRATALIVGHDLEMSRDDVALIRTDDPYVAFLKVLRIFAPSGERPMQGIHPSAVVAPDATVDPTASIGPNVVVGPGCDVGAGVVIRANAVLGSDVSIGEGSTIHPNVTLYHGTAIGRNVIVHAGAVIGADGFGFAPRRDGGWEKIPQIGIVRIEDEVEIGANATIDRGTMGETLIRRGVKIDNLVHVAHNVVVGENTVIAAQAGIAGSAKIGVGNMIGGQVGFVGHIETAPGVIVEPQSGVSKSVKRPGRYFGHPAKEHSLALKQEAAARQLPDLLIEIREMRNRLKRLEDAAGLGEYEA